MSQFGPQFDRAQRQYDSALPPEPDDGPDELDDAVPCFCGGQALFHVAKDEGDTPHLKCSNHHCGRIVPAAYRTIAEAVAIWNQEVQEAQCESHSWFVVEVRPGIWRCPHCGAEKNLGSAKA